MTPQRRAARSSTRAAARLAWVLWGLSAALTVLGLLLLTLNRSRPDVPLFDYWAEYAWGAVVFSTVGAVIASRRPENPIGWIFCAAGLVGGVHHLSAEHAIYALLAAPDTLPGGEAGAWIASWTWVPYIGLLLFLGLLFPAGRLPTHRWRWYAALVAAVCLAGAILVALSPGPIAGLGPITNPLGIGAIGGMKTDFLVQALLGALALLTAASMLGRLLRARGEERQQLKWFAYAATVLAGGVVLAYTVAPAIGVSWVTRVGFASVMVGTLGVPIAVGIAILRHHLYDIDVLINRTLVYGLLTATLGAVYFSAASCCSRESAACYSRFPSAPSLARRPNSPPSPLHSRSRRCSTRCVAASRCLSTAGSTAASTTPPRRWRLSPPGCERRRIWRSSTKTS